MFSDGNPNIQGADAEVSALRPSVGTAAGHQDDLPEVQKSSLGSAEAEAVAHAQQIGPPVCENTPTALNRSTQLTSRRDLPISIG
jgi:hypothetical protein